MVVLLVEHEIHVQFLIWKLLKANGCTVLTASNGEAALIAIRNYPASVDLLLTAMEIPIMNGLELSRLVLAERPETKVIVMSPDLRARAECEDEGLLFLRKPFQLSAIPQTIEAILGPTLQRVGPGSVALCGMKSMKMTAGS